MSGFYWDSANPTPQIKMTLSSGVLTVSCEGVCKVLFEKQGTPGDVTELDLSGRSWSISDDGADDEFLGAFGVTNSVLWGSAMPWFAYLVNKDNTAANVKLGLSRDPTKGVTPAATNNIGYTSNAAVTSAQGNMFLAHTANTSYNGVPCQLIGTVTATSTSQAGTQAGYKWTFGTLTAGRDGIGNMALAKTFATEWEMPLGQNGAKAGEFFSTDSNGDMPDWTTDANITASYWIKQDGTFNMVFTTQTAGAATDAGADAETLQIHTPYSPVSAAFSRLPGPCLIRKSGGANALGFTTMNLGDGKISLYSAANSAALSNEVGGTGTDDLSFNITIQAF